jgi:uncharacterized protein involved in exopolysaccharide biosynthesis
MSTKKEISTFDMNEENKKNFDLKTIICIIKANIKFFFTIFLFISIFVALISLFLSDIFRANTKILPPQQNQSATSAILSQLGGFAGGATSALGLKNSNDIFVGFLKSRTVADNLIKRFNLKEHYNLGSLEKTRLKLEANSTISYGKDNIISIDIEDKDPTLAANIANAYVEELVVLTNKFALTEASQRRIFFEKQLLSTKEKLMASELLLSKSIKESGVVSVDVQSKSILESSAKIRAGISLKEIQLKTLQGTLTPNNQIIKKIQQEISAMRQELATLETGTESSKRKTSFSDEKDNIQNSSNNFQALRDVKYYQIIYETLAKQYEAARLDEAKDAPLIQVLDSAIIPERKIKPQRALIIFGGIVTGLLVALFLTIIKSKKI